jgi:iron-sulfur cluster insertion protein
MLTWFDYFLKGLTEMISEMELSVTNNAIKRIANLLKAKQDDNLCFRVGVLPGGCSGFEYEFKLDSIAEKKAEDVLFEHQYDNQIVSVVSNQNSLNIIKGSTLDYVEELHSSRFVVSNPNAEASCGCGISFCIKK